MTAAIFLVFFGLLVIGVPIAVALAMGALVPLALFRDMPLTVIIQKFFTALDSLVLMAIPFFMIAGGFLEKGGVSRRLVNLSKALVGWMPGGLAVVTIWASAFFGAIVGSAAATVAAVGTIMFPAMVKEGYPLKFSLATIAAAGLIGVVLPPSNPMILYGLAGSVSIGEVFMGGIIPGVLIAASMSVYAIIYGKMELKNIAVEEFAIGKILPALKDAIWAIIMPIIVLGGIYGGVFTPTEAAAVASLYGLIIGVFVYKELDVKKIFVILKGAVITSAMVMFIIAAASAFGYVMTLEMIPRRIATAIMSIATDRLSFWIVVTIMLFIIGTFLDTSPAILILTPILLPIARHFDIDPVAFGVVIVVNLGIGLVTPPSGLNLFVASSLAKVGIETVINKHVFIYLGFATLVLILIMAFPGIILLIPNMMR